MSLYYILDLIKEGLLPRERPIISDDEDEGSMKNFVVHEKPKGPPAAPPIFMQKPFQSASTPAHLMHRFMVWNAVGIIRCYAEDEVSSIDVEFHDASVHHPLHLTNLLNHTMAALSSTAAVLACQSEDDVPSKLVCLHFGTWDSTKEWSIPMPSLENILAIAVNESFIAVATDVNLVRLFSIGGVQYNMFSISGPIVTMAMCTNQLFIVYHLGTGLPKSQCLGVKIIELNQQKCRTCVEQQLPISKESSLVWIGFTVEGTPVTVDSTGSVRMLQRSFGDTWIPIMDLKAKSKNKSDNYWVIGITESPPEIQAIPCKGAVFPPTLPKPVPAILPFQLPLCDMSTDKGQLEENYLRTRVVNAHHSYCQRKALPHDVTSQTDLIKEQQTLLIKLFALSCKSDRDFRALEICELMPNTQTVNLAIQYASRMKRMNLAQRISELALRKAAEEENSLLNQWSDDNDDIVEEKVMVKRNPLLGIIPRSGSKVSVSGRHKFGFSLRGGKRTSITKPTRDEDISSEDESVDTLPEKNEESDNDIKDDDSEMEDTEEDDGEKKELTKAESGLKQGRSTPTMNGVHVSMTSSQGRSNPFKINSQKSSSQSAAAASKGTSFFEKLESKNLQKIKLGQKKTSPDENAKEDKQKNHPKQAKLFSKGAAKDKQQEPKKNSNTKEDEAPNKKLSGFQLFVQSKQADAPEDEEELEEESIIQRSLENWKGLSSSEKKEWNKKAKEGSAKEGSNPKELINMVKKKIEKDQIVMEEKISNSTENKTINGIEKNKEDKKDTSSSKSKLASFAFQKK